MNKSYTFKDSETDWERINAMPDEEIDLSDIPEITASQMARATRRVKVNFKINDSIMPPIGLIMPAFRQL